MKNKLRCNGKHKRKQCQLDNSQLPFMAFTLGVSFFFYVQVAVTVPMSPYRRFF